MSQAGAEPDEMTQAIQLARGFLLHAFRNENVESVALEEVKPRGHKTWDVTLSFLRKRDLPTPNNTFNQIAFLAAASRPERVYKVVTVDVAHGEGVSIVNRKDD